MSVFFLFLIVPILVGVLLGLNWVLSPQKPDAEKISTYEAGSAIVLNQNRLNFSISFYLVALLFLIFDLEIAIIFPIASILYEVDVFGFSIAILFLIILTIGFVYEFSSGAIKATNQDSPFYLIYTVTDYLVKNVWTQGIMQKLILIG